MAGYDTACSGFQNLVEDTETFQIGPDGFQLLCGQAHDVAGGGHATGDGEADELPSFLVVIPLWRSVLQHRHRWRMRGTGSGSHHCRHR